MEGLSRVFTTICNMSTTACFVILLVNFARFFLRKSPKKYSYYLWGIVGFRLVCPVSFSSIFSLFNLNAIKNYAVSGNTMTWSTTPDYMNSGSVYLRTPALEEISGLTDEIMYETSGDKLMEINKIDVFVFVWLLGMILLLGYQLYSYMRLRNRLETAVRLEENIFESDQIKEPFVLGLFRPEIYLPFRMSESEREYILLHEKYHIKRHDHLVKIAAVILLGIYWFNPLAWFSYFMMCKDMEMSCDEWVIEKLGSGIKERYSYSLLEFANDKKRWNLGTLAFGENSVKERVQNILNYKTAGKVIAAISIALCVIVLVIGITNGRNQNAVRNVTKSSEFVGSSELEFLYSEEISGYLMYYELYQGGELAEYAILDKGRYCPTDLSTKYERNDEILQVSLKCVGENNNSEQTIRVDLEQYGWKTYTNSYYLQGIREWQTFDAGQDIVLAACNFDIGDGVTGYSCELYQDETMKSGCISVNDGVLLVHIVFGAGNLYELQNEYQYQTPVRELFEAKNPYIGDHVADGAVLRTLMIPSIGDFGMELQTSEEPYGMILHFEETPINEIEFHEKMLKRAALFLTVTENAGYFEWTYPSSDGTIKRQKYSVEDIEQILEISELKAYASTRHSLNDLVTELENIE